VVKTGKLCCFNSKRDPAVWSCQPREDNHYRARISNFYETLVEKQNFEEITQGKIKIIGNIT
jgi:hypothetical protein